MDRLVEYFTTSPSWLIALLSAMAVYIVAAIIKRFTLNHLIKIAISNGKTHLTSFAKGMQLALSFALLALAIKVFELVMLYYGEEFTGSTIDRSAQILLLVALFLFMDSMVVNVVRRYAQTHSSLLGSRVILQTIVHSVFIVICVLMTLSTLGISITPLIASLGITSLAVALALQPTLENFFSGVQILIDKPIRLGDFIELESGEQGFVEKIGWRSTWIKMLPNNIVIMPNSLISKSKLINYYYPEKELSVPVEVGVHYDSDLEHVERVTLEVAREILASHKWGISDYETFVVYHTFDNSSINFTVMLRAQEYFNRFFIKSAFIKALHQRYREEGITIPYPIRAINYDQEKAEKEI
jgi:small-conductance mechanosensitive channel